MSNLSNESDRLNALAATNRHAARFGTREQLLASEHALAEAIVSQAGALMDVDFTGIYLADIDFPVRIQLGDSSLNGACLSNLNIEGSFFDHCTFDGASLDGMSAWSAFFNSCHFGMAIMDRNVLDTAGLFQCDLTQVSLYGYPSVNRTHFRGSRVSPGFLAYLQSLTGEGRPASLPTT